MTNDSTHLLTCGKEYEYGTHMTGNNGPLCSQSNTRFNIQIQEYSDSIFRFKFNGIRTSLNMFRATNQDNERSEITISNTIESQLCTMLGASYTRTHSGLTTSLEVPTYPFYC